MTTATSTRMLGFALTTALATTMLAGCAGKAAPSAAASAEAAKAALAKGKGEKAVAAAEAAVLANPRDGETRALLGAAYLEAGRFLSAASAYADAMALGDTSDRTVLTQSLALSAAGRYPEAQALLAQHQSNLDAADYGLAITLAGSPQQGIEVLSNAIRYGENTAKTRQNLAYAFALKGDWRSARLLAAQDLPANKVDQRLGEWAQMAMPQMSTARVARLLGVVAKPDSGQPVHLALNNFPTNEQLAAEAATQGAVTVPVESPALALADAELPAADAIAGPDEAPVALARYEAEPELTAAPAPVATSSTPAAPRIKLPAPQPVRTAPVRVAAAKPVAAKPSPAFEAAFVRQPGAYRVQLGSYFTQSDANAAWLRFQKRHPELKGTDRVITKATVNGRTYYRVAAGGFARSSARTFCSMVKQDGGGCFAYSSTRSLPGAAPSATRMATLPAGKPRIAAR